jgi:predicted RNA binding protein YcfA (HicA-like mRNA interferase family)
MRLECSLQRHSVAVPLSQKKAIKLLQQHGWTQTVGAKHSVKMTKAGQRPITLPRHRGEDYGRGLTWAILRQARLEDEWN